MRLTLERFRSPQTFADDVVLVSAPVDQIKFLSACGPSRLDPRELVSGFKRLAVSGEGRCRLVPINSRDTR
jgi:hypothetical protein